MKAPLVALALALLAHTALAESVSVTVEAEGSTREEAVTRALSEAIRQVNGVALKSDQIFTTNVESTARSDDSGSNSSFDSNLQQSGQLKAKSSGFLNGYRVVDSAPSDGGFHVTVEADVFRYKAPGVDDSGRRKLAVIPFTSRLATVDFFGPVTGDELAALLSQAVLTQFTQSRRFAVLDRESDQAIQAERRRYAASPSIAEQAKLGSELGADYLVVGEIVEADAAVYEQHGSLTGQTRVSSHARLSASFRIVVPATGQVKYADSMDLALHSPDGQADDSRSGAINEFAKRLVGSAVDRIYPMKVISMPDDQTVVLNQGGSTLSPGDQLLLVEEGEDLTDPYTRESLGKSESTVGRIEVVRSDGKVAYARAVGTSGASLRTGLIARRSNELYGAGETSAEPEPGPRTDGFYLPGDSDGTFTDRALTVKGEGRAPDDKSLSRAERGRYAMAAAKATAEARLTVAIGEIRLKGETTLAQSADRDDKIRQSIERAVASAKVTARRYDPVRDVGTIFLKLTMDGPGGAMSILAPEVASAGLYADEAPPFSPARPVTAPDAPADGLIIDASGLGLQPAMQNRIVAGDDSVLFSPGSVPSEILASKGVGDYTDTVGKAKAILARHGSRNPMVVRASQVVRTTDARVSDADAAGIFSSNQRTQFLESAHVVFVL